MKRASGKAPSSGHGPRRNVLPLPASTHSKRSNSHDGRRQTAAEGEAVTRDRDGFLIPRPLSVKPQGRKPAAENTAKPAEKRPRARIQARWPSQSTAHQRGGLTEDEKKSGEDVSEKEDASEEEKTDTENETLESSSTSEDDLDDEDYEEEEEKPRVTAGRIRPEAFRVSGKLRCSNPLRERRAGDLDNSSRLPALLDGSSVSSGPARGGEAPEPGRKRGRGTGDLRSLSRRSGDRKSKKLRGEVLRALDASLDSLISVTGVQYCPQRVAEAIAAEISKAQGETNARERAREGEEDSEGGRDARCNGGRQTGGDREKRMGAHAGKEREERERQRDENAAATMATLAAAVLNMLVEVGGLPSPLFHANHLAPLLIQSYAVLRRASTRRKSPSSLSRLDALALPAVSLPPPASAPATAARRILQRGICRLFAQLIEEKTAGVSAGSVVSVSLAPSSRGPAGESDGAEGAATGRNQADCQRVLKGDKASAPIGERQQCALLEFPRQTFHNFRSLLKSVFFQATLICQSEGSLEPLGSLGLLGLLSGLAGSGARRIRAAATLAVLGISEGLAASLASLHAEESKFHQQLLQLQCTHDVPALPSSSSSSSSWGERVVEDIRGRLDGAERSTRVSVQLLEVLAAESLAFRSRDVCPLIRAETLHVMASYLLPALPALVLGCLPFQAAVLSALADAAGPKASVSVFQSTALLSSLEFFSVALSLLLPREASEKALPRARPERRSEAAGDASPAGSAGDNGDETQVDDATRQKAETFVKAARPLVLLLAAGSEDSAVAALHALLPAAKATRSWREAGTKRSTGEDAAKAHGRRRTEDAGEAEGGETRTEHGGGTKTPGERGEKEESVWVISEEEGEKLLSSFWTSKGTEAAAAAAPILDELFLGGRLAAENASEETPQEGRLGPSTERGLRLLLSFCLAHLPRSPPSSFSAAVSSSLLFACADRVVDGFWGLAAGVKQPKRMLELLVRGEAEGDERCALREGERKLLLQFCARSFQLLQLRQREAQQRRQPSKVRRVERARAERERDGARLAPGRVWGCEASLREDKTEKKAKRTPREEPPAGRLETEAAPDEERDREREDEEREEKQFLVEGTEAVFANLPMLLRIHQADRDELYLLLAGVYWAAFPPPCLSFHLSQRALTLSPSSLSSAPFVLSSFPLSPSPLSAACTSPVSICAHTSPFFSPSGALAALTSVCLSASSPLAVRTAFSCLSNLALLLAPLDAKPVSAALSRLHASLLSASVASGESLQALLFRHPAAKVGGDAREEGRGPLPLDSQREDAQAPPVFDLSRLRKSRKHRELVEMHLVQLEANLLRLASFYSTCLSFLAEPRGRDSERTGRESALESFHALSFPSLATATETAVAILHMRVMASMAEEPNAELATVHGEERIELNGPAEMGEVPEIPTPRLVLHASDLLLAIYSHLAYRSLFLYSNLTGEIRRVAQLETYRAQGASVPEIGGDAREGKEKRQAEKAAMRGWDADLEDGYAGEKHILDGWPAEETDQETVESRDAARRLAAEAHTGEQETGKGGERDSRTVSAEIEHAREGVSAVSRQLQETLAEAAACRNRSTVLLAALLETETRPLLLFNSLVSVLTLAQVEGAVLSAREACCRALSSVSVSPSPRAESPAVRSPELLLPSLHAYEYIPSDLEAIVSAFQHFLDLLGSSSEAFLSPEKALSRRLCRAAEKTETSFPLPSHLPDLAGGSSSLAASSLFSSALSGTACAPLLATARYDASALSYLDSVVLASSPSFALCTSPQKRQHAASAQEPKALEACAQAQPEDGPGCDFKLRVRESMALGCCRLARQSCLRELRWAVGGLGASLLSMLDHPSAPVAMESRLLFQTMKRQNFRLLLQMLLQTAQDLFDARLLTPLTLLLLERREREREGRGGVGGAGEAVATETRDAEVGDSSLVAEDVEERFSHLVQWSVVASQRLSVGVLAGAQQMEMVNFWRAAIRHNRCLANAAAEYERRNSQDESTQETQGKDEREEEEKAFQRAREEVLWQLQVGGRERREGDAEGSPLVGVERFPRLQFLDFLHPFIQRGSLPTYLLNQLLGVTKELIKRKEEEAREARVGSGAHGRRVERERENCFVGWETSGEKRLFEAVKKKEGWMTLLQTMREKRQAAEDERAKERRERERRDQEPLEDERRKERQKRAHDVESAERGNREERENERREVREERREERDKERREARENERREARENERREARENERREAREKERREARENEQREARENERREAREKERREARENEQREARENERREARENERREAREKERREEREKERREEREKERREEREKERREEKENERRERERHGAQERTGDERRQGKRRREESEGARERMEGVDKRKGRQGQEREGEKRRERRQFDDASRGARGDKEPARPREQNGGEREEEAAKETWSRRELWKEGEEDSEDELCARLEKRSGAGEIQRKEEAPKIREEIPRQEARQEERKKRDDSRGRKKKEVNIFSSEEDEDWRETAQARRPRQERLPARSAARKPLGSHESESDESEREDASSGAEDLRRGEKTRGARARRSEEAPPHEANSRAERHLTATRETETVENDGRGRPKRDAKPGERETHAPTAPEARAKPRQDDEDLWNFSVSPVPRRTNLPVEPDAARARRRECTPRPAPSVSSEEGKGEFTGSELDVWSDDDGSLFEKMERVCSLLGSEKKSREDDARGVLDTRPRKRQKAAREEEPEWDSASQATSFAEDLLDF
uniref:Uncharacterized protein n=1 Tax=Neospora caninum (strain Liverpool) TaxID=572307 RepID=A0A0F7UEA1_NEOCL|nr:TPA: hypothetical protein BN1204_031570 [Neospora caninum Liverpool]